MSSTLDAQRFFVAEIISVQRFVTREFSGFPDELDWTMQVFKINQIRYKRNQDDFWSQAAELFELATESGLQPKTDPHWTAGYE